MKYLLLAALVLLSACGKQVNVTDPTAAYKRGRFQVDNPAYNDNIYAVEDVQTGQKYIMCYRCQLTPLKDREAP